VGTQQANKSPQRAARACRHVVMHGSETKTTSFFYRWHVRFGTCYINPLMKIIRRAKKSVSCLFNSRPRKKTIESELLASSLVGDGGRNSVPPRKLR